MEFFKRRLSLQLFSVFSLSVVSSLIFANPIPSQNKSFYSSNAIAAGLYSTAGNTTLPLLATTNNGGSTWVYPGSILTELPSDIGTESFFTGASCSGFTCLASGSYRKNVAPGLLHPLLAASNDGGLFWRYPPTIISNLPSNFRSGSFVSAPRCSGAHCIAAGHFFTDPMGRQYPLLAMSHNVGITWNYPSTIISELPADFAAENATFNAITSWGDTFIAVGQYQNTSDHVLPLLSQSGDEGVTWNYPDSVFTNLPSDLGNEAVFNSVNCETSTCVVAGSYISTHTDNPRLPLLAVDHGRVGRWNYSPITNLPLDFLSVINITKISCSKNNCVVTGQYQSSASATIKYPLLISSQDNGNHWHYPETIISNLPADFQNSGNFNGAHCNRNICIVVGQYNSATRGLVPLAAISFDSGRTWTYPDSITTNLPTDTVSGILNGVHCNAADCNAEGQYQVTSGTFFPLIATSHDSGLTWSYPSSVVSNLPSSYANNGIFNGGYSSFTLKK